MHLTMSLLNKKSSKILPKTIIFLQFYQHVHYSDIVGCNTR